MRPFVALRWWPFALLILLVVALVALAGALESRRQYDDAVLPSTGEHPNAHAIRGVFGLHETLQRGQVIGWSVALLLSGVAFGSMTKSLQDAAKANPLLASVLAVQGLDGIYTTMTQFLAAATTAFVAAAVLRLSRDEQSGLAEPVLAGSVSRWCWLLTAVAAAVLSSAVLMLCAGFGNGLGAGITLGEPATVARLTAAGLAFVPAMAVVAAVAALAVAVKRPWVAWLFVTYIMLSLYLGALLRLPRGLIDASPVGRTTAPTHVPVTALLVMISVAIALTAVAGVIYRRRDVV